jgi:hypothetical protein
VTEAVSALDNPASAGTNGFTLVSALYIAERIASGKFPADSYSVSDWDKEYIKAIGCENDIAEWESFFAGNTGDVVET